MSFFQQTKKVCIGLLLSAGLASPVYAFDTTEDILGDFLKNQLPAVQYSAQPVPYNPAMIQQQAAYAGPLLNAQSALIMNANTGQIFYQKNMDNVRSIASISKLMAAMVVLDARLDMNQRITITEAEIDRLKGTGSRLSIGTTLTRGQMLHLGLMSSENRAIHALGRTYPGGMSAFVQAMNAKARSLGMMNSRFYEPTGLDPRNVSTARELSMMVRAASQYPQIRQLSTAQSGEAYTSTGKFEQYKNSNVFVREGNWNITVQKTGYIREAGRSMVMQTQMGREPVIIVVLGSQTTTTRANDARALSSMVQQYPM
ncbi:serine hydrolase [Kingella kingae]|uniref:serine hydrolase n=1 Tax=Kingella kingae TaxID=504 RepID=UPI0004063E23|nr:serine hydrolase [Kingella kingae]MDK4573838.1 serine hydrolase [Kingella kingae]MDK4605892.1 serine hydrolase [Kingella kingae]